MTDEELDRILTFYWPLVTRRAMGGQGDEWTQGFVKSIARHGKRPRWRPTDRQASIMRRLVFELGQMAEPDIELIER